MLVTVGLFGKCSMYLYIVDILTLVVVAFVVFAFSISYFLFLFLQLYCFHVNDIIMSFRVTILKHNFPLNFLLRKDCCAV